MVLAVYNTVLISVCLLPLDIHFTSVVHFCTALLSMIFDTILLLPVRMLYTILNLRANEFKQFNHVFVFKLCKYACSHTHLRQDERS